MLQYAAGMRTEPPVSVPSAPKAISAITAAADPPEDAAGIRSKAHGLRTGPKYVEADDPPAANSCRFVFPIMTAPANLSFRTTSVSSLGIRSLHNSLRDVLC